MQQVISHWCHIVKVCAKKKKKKKSSTSSCDSFTLRAVPPFIPHLGTLWSSRSSSPWSWRSRRRSSMSRTHGPSSNQWSNSSSLCPGSISLNNLQTPTGPFPELKPPAANRQTPERIPWWGCQARPLEWNTIASELPWNINCISNCMYSLLGPTLCLSYSWPWEGEVGIPAQPKPAKTTLCHRSPCDLEFLCPSPVSSPSLSLQKQVCGATYSTEHPIPALIRLPCLSYCALSLRDGVCVCVSLSPCSQLSTSLQSIAQGRRQWGQGRGELGVCFASCVCSLSCLSHLCYCCLLLFFLTLFLQNSCDPGLPVVPSHSLPPQNLKRKGGMRAVGRSPDNCARGPCWAL